MIELDGLPIRAVSVGGLETCIELPSLRLCFDIGRCPPTAHAARTVLLTHAHLDHMGGVPHHAASRDLLGMPPPLYVLPAEDEAAFHAMLDAWRRLSRSALPCEVLGVRPGDRVPLGKSREAMVFRAIHRVPTVGYAVVERRGRLRDDLRGLPQEAIAARARAGEEVSVTDEVVRVAFCGDTTVDVIDREPLVRRARVLLLEVTFADDRVDPAHARHHGHVHLDELIPRLDRLEARYVLCTHASWRYKGRYADLLAARTPEAWRGRLVPLPIGGAWADPEA